MIKNSLQKRLLLYVLTTTMILMIGISTLNYVWAQRVVVDVSEERAIAMVEAASARIQSYLLQKGQYAWILAQNEQIHKFVKNVRSHNEDLSENLAYSEMLKSFQRIVEESSDIVFVYIGVEKTQRLYANTEFIYPPDYKVSARPWYKNAVKEKKMVFSAPYICPLTGNFVVTVSVPFYDENKNLLGVAAVDILSNKIQNIIASVKIFNDDYALVLDRKGNIIACSNSNNEINNIEELLNMYPNSGKLIEGMMNGKQGQEKITVGKTEKYVFYFPIKDILWSIAFVIPVKDVSQPIFSLGRVSFITVIIGLGIIFLLLNALTLRIISPLKNFANLMKQVEKGDYTVRADILTDDELGYLGQGLNNMLEQQEKLIGEVIQTAYKMGIAGHELTITIGEMRTILPIVTTNLSKIIEEEGIINKPKNEIEPEARAILDFLEKIILLNHKCRSLNERVRALGELIDKDEQKGKKFKSVFYSMDTEFVELFKQIENLQLDFAELNDRLENSRLSFMDSMSTMKQLGKHIDTIASLQVDNINRATSISKDLVIWSQSLLKMTSLFNIKDENRKD